MHTGHFVGFVPLPLGPPPLPAALPGPPEEKRQNPGADDSTPRDAETVPIAAPARWRAAVLLDDLLKAMFAAIAAAVEDEEDGEEHQDAGATRRTTPAAAEPHHRSRTAMICPTVVISAIVA